MDVVKRIVGGRRGNSGGKDSRALRKPPSLRKDKMLKSVPDLPKYA